MHNLVVSIVQKPVSESIKFRFTYLRSVPSLGLARPGHRFDNNNNDQYQYW